MDNIQNILFAALWFALMGGLLGLALAIASKVFAVKVDERIPAISEKLPGANCGGCGYAGCSALAEAIVKGEAKTSACVVGGDAVASEIAAIMGMKAEKTVRMRAQVMCSGSAEFAKRKYNYEGAPDCIAATRLGGGNKLCPNGCIGLGTCVSICPFDAIRIENGVSAVDYEKCQGCGKCVEACPKHIIKLIPYDSTHWVGCMSVDKGAVARSYCDVGCISCRICEKNCQHDAIHVNNFVAVIDYDKCVMCGVCVEKCPRKIIWSDKSQRTIGITLAQESLKSNP
ncbi:MAG: RnfABCDGE type electron transport complex subunit B [Clostridia bacterium]|nr:RnfABCDGE type electron transport complex subunit B [Clostridia bacterium]